MNKRNPFSFVSIVLNKFTLSTLFIILLSLNSFSQSNTNTVTYFEDFNTAGYPTNIPADSYWMYYREIDPSQNTWNKFIPGDGNAYITVDADISNDLDDVNPFQSLIFGGVGENHRLEVRMKGAVVDGGLVSFLFTYEQEGSEFNEIDIELVADDTATASHPTLSEDGGWTDARFNTWRNANENTNRPFTGTKKAVVDQQNEKISLIDDEFHVYTIDWRSDRIEFFIDGILQETLTTNIATGKAEVIFGFRDLSWAGDFNWSGKHTMVIDYFKIEPLDNFLLAIDDHYTMVEGETLEIRPLTKGIDDRDPNNLDINIFSIAGEEINYSSLPQTINVEESGVEVGTVVVSSNEITFTPSIGKTGTVTFPYVIKNTNNEESTANQIIQINEASSSGNPTATDDSYTMDQGETLKIRPLKKGENDSDPGDLDLTIFSIAGEEIEYNALPQTIDVEQAGNVLGTVIVKAYEIIFTPLVNTTGNVTFPYVIKNTIGESATANQIIEINEVSSSGGPTATDDSYTIDQGETLEIRPLKKGENDSDPGDLNLTIFSIAGEEVEYNSLPQTIDVEQAGNVLGTVSVTIDEILFTPSANTTGNVTFPYVIKNTIGESATANQIIEINGASSSGGPTATDDSYTIDQGETLEIRPLKKGENDSDPGDLDLTIFSIAGEEVEYNALPQTIDVEQAGNVLGTVTVTVDEIIFTPSANTTGNVTFPYVIKNSIGESATANQIIEIKEVSSSGGPTATDDSYTIDQGETLEIRPLKKGENDSDPGDLDLTIFSIAGEEVEYNALPQTIDVEQAGNVLGTVTVTIDEIIFAPSANTTGNVTFPYVIKNTIGESATANQIIEVIPGDSTDTNSPSESPSALDDLYSLDQGGSRVIKPLTRHNDDYDPNGLALTISHIGGEEIEGGVQDIQITNATISIDKDGEITFTPNPNFSGTITFPYIIKNTNNDTDTGLVTMIVDAVTTSAAAPNAVDDFYTISKNAVQKITPLTYGASDSDPNGEILRLSYINGEEVYGGNQIIEVPNGKLQVNGEDDIIFIPNTDYLGVAMFSYEISNATGITDTGLQTIEILESTTLNTDDFLLSTSNIIVYPNPSKGDVRVRLKSNLNTNAKITLSDVTGKTIYNSRTELKQGENTLDFNFKVGTGIMFLRITNDNQSITKKLIFK